MEKERICAISWVIILWTLVTMAACWIQDKDLHPSLLVSGWAKIWIFNQTINLQLIILSNLEVAVVEERRRKKMVLSSFEGVLSDVVFNRSTGVVGSGEIDLGLMFYIYLCFLRDIRNCCWSSIINYPKITIIPLNDLLNDLFFPNFLLAHSCTQ